MYTLVVPLTFHEVKVPQTVGLSSLMTDCLECWAPEDFLMLNKMTSFGGNVISLVLVKSETLLENVRKKM